MPSNVTMNDGNGSIKAVTKQVTHDGDTAQLQGVSQLLVSGTEDNYTAAEAAGGAGAVSAGVQRMTLASDDPAVVDLAAIEVLLGTIDADTGNAAASLALIDNAIGEDGAAVLPSHVACIGGNDGTSVHAAKVIAPADNLSPGRGLVTNSIMFGWDGSAYDRIPGTSADGLLVNLGANNDITIGAALPTGGNTIGDVTISGAALASLQLIDDTIFADDAAFTPASSKVSAVGYLFDDAATDTVDEGDIGIGRMSNNRCQYMQIRDAAGNERGANVNASNQLLVLDANSAAILTAVQLIDNAVSGAGFNITQLNGVNVTMGNGASGTGVQRVTVANDSTGILAGVTTVTTVTTVSTLTGGGVAHDGADSGNPHKIGAKAQTALSDNTLVADNDRTDAFADLDGVLLSRQDAPLGDNTSGQAAITDGSSTSVIAAQGANIKTYITDVTIANSSATDVTVDLRDGTAGSVKWTFPVPAGGGVVFQFRRPLAFTANTAVAADPSAAASTITVSLGGFKSKV